MRLGKKRDPFNEVGGTKRRTCDLKGLDHGGLKLITQPHHDTLEDLRVFSVRFLAQKGQGSAVEWHYSGGKFSEEEPGIAQHCPKRFASVSIRYGTGAGPHYCLINSHSTIPAISTTTPFASLLLSYIM